ncbi:MAG TPA: ABC transporter substrate-binding protein [Polyangia bacterium]|nr:ABC transporter substrate-binding protein [Polyangia bacterium]
MLRTMSPRVLIPLLVFAAAPVGRAAGPQGAPVEVRVGTNFLISDAALFIAQHKGYFKEQGIELKLISFDAGPKMVAPLGAGQLEVAAGATSAGLFNAIARGIDIKIVADKGSSIPGASYMPIIVRKDLVTSGKVKSGKDLKGLKVAEAGQGGSPASTLNETLAKAGLAYPDVTHVPNMAYPQHLAALANGAVDASVTTEPTLTKALEEGVAVRLPGGDAYPNQQISVLLYGGEFIKKQPDVARRFMVAYLKGARDYNDAIKDGHLLGRNADEAVSILASSTHVKDAALIRKVTASGCNPNGRVNRASLQKDLAFFKAAGFIEGTVTVDQAVDDSFADAAVKVLGPYKPRR